MLRDAFTVFDSYLTGTDVIRSSDRFAQRIAAYDNVMSMFVVDFDGSVIFAPDLLVAIEHSGDGVHWSQYSQFTLDGIVGWNVPVPLFDDTRAAPHKYVRLAITPQTDATGVHLSVTVALRDLDWVAADPGEVAEEGGTFP
jgi:hypothetical protein